MSYDCLTGTTACYSILSILSIGDLFSLPPSSDMATTTKKFYGTKTYKMDRNQSIPNSFAYWTTPETEGALSNSLHTMKFSSGTPKGANIPYFLANE